jgi:putative oxidoreductase
MNSALLIVRLILGLGMAAHGAQKLFGWFGGYGLTGTGGFFAGLGFRPGVLFAFLAGLGEFAGGVLTALGLLGPIGPALMILVMIVAAVVVHARHGFFVTSNGVEVTALYTAGALAIAFAGPGAYALDPVAGLDWLWTARNAEVAIAAAVILAVLNILARCPVAGPAATS